MKYTLVIISLIISFSFVFSSCVPTNNSAASNTAGRSNARSDSREAAVNNNPRNNNNNNAQVRRGDNRLRNANAENVRTIPRPNENGRSRSSGSKSSASSNPFEKRQHALKNITNEGERFLIDTTYYLLTMEAGVTKATNSSANLAAGFANNQEFRESLIRSFDAAIAEFEHSALFDCNMFRMFSSQFSFSDSLRQTAIFYYAECCVSNNNLEEAIIVLEALNKEKMNRTVAPKAIVRLGQLYCVTGDLRQADKHFKRLKREHPRSIYNQIADCSRM